MPFPSSQREIYAVNPLNEVVCQIRYPAVLEISATSPAQFQNAIRDTYPWYEEQKSSGGLPSVGLPKEVADFLATMPFPPIGQSLEHHFSAEDRSRSISLTQEFIAVIEHQYTKWEDFQKEVQLAELVLRDTYTPAFYNRVGLRYVNVLIRDEIGLPETPWSELLNPTFIGMLSDHEVADDIRELQVEALLSIPDVTQGQVLLRHGLARTETGHEQVYVIDADFQMNRRSEPDDVFEALERFNRWGGHLFRWATSEKLRVALGRTAS